MTIDELLETYREVFAMTAVEKGERFERLMRNFLLTYPVWRGTVSEVWRWKNFPYRNEFGGKDLGIDLVVKTHDGEFWAAQCKFYAETTTIDKNDVDSFISNSARTFDGGKKFSRRLWISTSDKFNSNARESLKNQSPAIEFINLASLRRAQVDWLRLDNGFAHEDALISRELRDYQLDAINAAQVHFQNHDRGQLIMACGTGKTFTALKIAETIAPDGKILFLVPSISLLSQTLEEWATFADKPINAICICSDATATESFDDDIVDVNLPLPAMTDSVKILAALKNLRGDGLTVIFSTYQSIEVVHNLNLDFDLVICDEAHRTTGYSDGDKLFTKIHNAKFIKAQHRLYMTATPKLFKTDVKESTNVKNLSLWSMDDKTIFGEEFYRISFREAIERGCLSDYKVFILTVDERDLNSELRQAVNDKKSTLTADDALKLIGCINALSKNMDAQSARLIKDDPDFMKTAVAFCRRIKDSEHIAKIFPDVQAKYLSTMNDADKNLLVAIQAAHIDGTMRSAEREGKLYWLKNPPNNICRLLNNVRCLSEGVDVPALDAIIFLASRKSKVDIVQAVGRVMRKAPNKKFGYIIIPVVVPLEKSPEEALAKSKDFDIVWDVINALRAHDDAMNVEIERIKNTGGSNRIIPSKTSGGGSDTPVPVQLLLPWDELRNKIYARMVEHVGNRLYWIQWANKVADIVERHTRRIKEIIATDSSAQRAFDNFVYDLQHNLNPAVTNDDAIDMLAQHLITRPVFEALFENYSFTKNNPVSVAMQKILDKLEGDGMTKDREIFNRLYDQVRDMCSNMGDAANRQRIIIRLYDSFFRIALAKTAEKLGIVYTPVEVVDFILRSVDDVLYKYFGRRLTDKNVHVLDPFAGTGTFLVRLIQSGLIKPRDILRKYHGELHANEIVLLAYYIASINIENAFYDSFKLADSFKLQALSFEEKDSALKDQSSQLKASNELQALSFEEKNLKAHSSQLKASNELQALSFEEKDSALKAQSSQLTASNELQALSFEEKNPSLKAHSSQLTAFPGICFTDTFELYERGEQPLKLQGVMKENSARVNEQKSSRIEVIIGNPPYSVGQKSANDNNQNIYYGNLETRIKTTYAAKTAAKLKQALYDSYIKAFRWASDRIADGGVIGFVTNAGWLDGAAMDGLRKCFAEEFSAIYVFNLRGNARTQGEQRQREKGNVFGSGSRAPIAITILVKNPAQVGKADIFYKDIGDYLSREEKLDAIKRLPSVLSDEFKPLTPNERGDWINQRGDTFDTFIPLNPDKRFDGAAKSFFVTYSMGILTARDAWAYNFSRSELESNIRTTIDYYNTHEPTEIDTTKITWSDVTIQSKNRGLKYEFDTAQVVEAMYRPFCKTNLYYDRPLIERTYQMPKFFPTGSEENLLICLPGVGSSKDFSVLMTNKITDIQFQFNGQCFPLYWYEEARQGSLFGDNMTRRDGVSDWILNRARESFKLGAVSFEEKNKSLKAQSLQLKADNQITKEDIFYYVYGFLHLPSYRARFGNELKKSLPRIILVDDAETFWRLSRAGRELAAIHLNYETQPPAEVQLEMRNAQCVMETYRVTKMKLSKDKTTLTYNKHITIKNIPARAFEYVVNGRSPLEWVIERYQVKTDRASGIVNNPNDWASEHGNPRYILDLVLSSITVSLKTLDIVESLPEVDFGS